MREPAGSDNRPHDRPQPKQGEGSFVSPPPARNSTESARKKVPGRPFEKGKSGNPAGRTPLPEEIRELKESTLARAILILHDKIADVDYIAKLKPADLKGFLELAFDRLGLPKAQALTGPNGTPLLPQSKPIDLSKMTMAQLLAIAEATKG